MMLFWIFTSLLTAFISILSHTLFTRWLDPKQPSRSMVRFWLLFAARFILITGFLWQLVQQPPSILIICLILFLCMYAGSLYYIIRRKPQWFQPEIKKDSSVWMP